MPEGPSLIIAKEALLPFKGKKVSVASGSAKVPHKKLEGQKLLDIRTWGKHLLLCFDGLTVRIHFLMFGTYYINEVKKKGVPKLHLAFAKGELNFYTCAVKVIEGSLEAAYDWEADVMGREWNPRAARKKLKAEPEALVTDALLDQAIFSGVGNIIKSEVLYRIAVHPKSKVGALPPKILSSLIKEARDYAFDFLKWKKADTLEKHWLAYTKKVCGRDGDKLKKEYLGKDKRRTFFCETCQKIYK